MIAFIGVRISWLMVATKALFACDPARAASCEPAQLLLGELALGDVAQVGGEERLAAPWMTVMATSTGTARRCAARR